MEIFIRKGEKHDLPVVFELVKELALFERAPGEVSNTLEAMERDGFGPSPAFGLLVACNNTGITGAAIYYFKYSTWKGRGVYLEDIIVREEYRNRGIGSRLFEAVIQEAKKSGATQLQWQVLEWNEKAISFYRKFDASFDPEWINCRINENQLRNY